MPEKYLRRDELPLLLRHTGPTTLPEQPPQALTGPTVLCLHDAGLQSSIFSDLMTALGQDLTCLSFDLPGHGRSGSLDALPSVREMAEIATWIASWCRIERPILVGHGMGALVALEWASRQPGAVGGLVLCGLGRTLGLDDKTIEIMRQVTCGKAPRPFDPTRVAKDCAPELMKRAYMEGIATDPRATLVDFEASRRFFDDFEGKDAVVCPTRFIDGAAESNEARESAEKFARSMTGVQATVDLVEDAAHYLPFEQPEALAIRVREMANAAEAA